MTKFAAIEAARLARDSRDLTAHVGAPEPQRKLAHFVRTDFAVGRLYDDGKFEPTQYNMTRDIAESVAGRMRDSMTDAEVRVAADAGWNWGYRMLRGHGVKGQVRVAWQPTARRGRLKASK